MSGVGLPERIGRYHIRSVLGVGGFGSVVRAYDEELSSSVAIKVLADHWADDDEVRQRFLTEARHLRRVRNPSVISVYDIGELDDGRPFFVMELADRGSLAERLESRVRGVAPDPPGVVRLVRGLSDGLSALHAAGLVHRDLNPRNLLLRSSSGAGAEGSSPSARGGVTTLGASLVGTDERVVIGDLGLAKDVIESRDVSVVGGSPSYQAPEQLDPAGVIAPATDVYAASALLWEVLAGSTPPAHDEVATRLSELEPEWRPLLSRGLAGRVSDRHATIAEWADEVTALLGDPAEAVRGVTATTVPSAARVGLDECPYRGLAAYQSEHASMFFGREVLVGEAIDRLRHDRTLAIAGSSGSGKSSLLRAGVIPALAAGELAGSEQWPIVLMTPGPDPVHELDYQIGRVAAATVGASVGSAADDSRLRLQVDAVTDHTGGLVLCIDQFEELFTECDDDQEREHFLAMLAAILDPTASRMRLVVAMRADFFGHAAAHGWLARRFTDNQILVGPMERAELRRAITGPASRVGLEFDDGLVETLLEEAGSDAGSLPLLGHALVETWRRREGRRLTIGGFRDAGGVAGAIAQTAESVYASSLDAAERDQVRPLLLRMVTAGQGAPHTRRRLPLEELDQSLALTADVVEQLVEARLLTVDGDAVQIAHEALITEWPRLRGWIDDGIEDLRLRGHLSAAAAEWLERGKDPDLLSRGTPLATAREWAERAGGLIGPSEQEFLAASVEAADAAEADAARVARRERLVRGLALAGLVGVLLVSVVAWALIQRTRSDERSAAAEDRVLGNLGLVARLTSDNDPLLGLALGVEARTLTEGPNHDAWLAIVGARQTLAESGIVQAGSVDVGDALSVTARRAAPLAAVGRRNGEVVLVDTSRRSIVATLRGHTEGVEELAFSPDGSRLVTAGLDGQLLVWSVDGDLGAVPEPVAVFMGSLVWSVAWSPDGELLATATEDGAVTVLRATTGEILFEPEVEALDMLTVAFDLDGGRLLAANGRGLVWGWSLEGTASLEPIFSEIDAHGSDIWELVFSPDGDLFATASSDGTITIRDSTTGDLVATPFGTESPTPVAADVRGVQWANTGTAIVAGSEAGEVLMWDLELSEVVERQGPSVGSQVLDAVIQDDGTYLTIAADQTLRIWLSASVVPLGVELTTDDSGTYSVAIASSGAFAVTGDGDGTVRVHDAEAGDETLAVSVGTEPVRSLAVAPDGSTIVAAADGGRVAFIDATTGELSFVDAHDGLIRRTAFDPRGELVATGGVDGVVRLWSTDDLSLVTEFGSYRGGVGALAWEADGRELAVVGWDGRADVWNRDGSRLAGPLTIDDRSLFSVAFSPNGQRLAIGADDGAVTIWTRDLENQIGESFSGLLGGATGVAFVDDGSVLVASSKRGRVQLWDVESGRPVGAPLGGPAGALDRLAAIDDGRFATSSEVGPGVLWNVLDLGIACDVVAGRVDLEQPVYLGENGRLAACGDRS